MVYVILRNGKTLQYNSGEAIAIEKGTITVRTGDDTEPKWALVAHIPIDIVERAEFEKPCAIKRARTAPKRADY